MSNRLAVPRYDDSELLRLVVPPGLAPRQLVTSARVSVTVAPRLKSATRVVLVRTISLVKMPRRAATMREMLSACFDVRSATMERSNANGTNA
jgi:hypothetical protein